MIPQALLGLLLGSSAALCAPSSATQEAVSARATPQGGGFSYVPMIVGAADRNGDGEVAAAEWRAFTQGLSDQAGLVDRTRFKARYLQAAFDADRDGRTTLAELDAALRASASGPGTGGRRAGFAAGLARGVVVEAGDADGDGALSERERADLLAAAGPGPEAPLSEDALVAWVRRVETTGQGDRSAFTPAVFLLTLDGNLDADRDGSVTAADLERLFASLDADGNGTLAADELRPARRGGEAQAGGQDAGAIPFQRIPVQQREEPPLIGWQRNLEDALALSRSSGRPLLICVNMDGESASESLAWYRYRDPAFAELTSGFVPLIVSPDRHGPLDHDDRGRRLPDPRFGRVVDSEHIDIEPVLFERYFKGTRVAPRHLGIAPSGEILFDVYLVDDLAAIDAELEHHGKRDEPPEEGADEPDPAPPAAPATDEDLPIELRDLDGPRRRRPRLPLDSPDAADRERVEAAFVDGEWRERFRLASLALDGSRATQHPELLRMALRDPDGRVRRQAVWTVVREPGLAPSWLLPEALRASAEDSVLRGALTGALGRHARLAKDETRRRRAQRLYPIFAGLAEGSEAVDLARWRAALTGAEEVEDDAPTSAELDPLLEEVIELERSVADTPEDAALRLHHAERLMRLGRLLFQMGSDPSAALEDARVEARAAEAAGVGGGRPAAVLCYASYMLGDPPAAAEHGARALPGLVDEAGSSRAALVLHTFALARTRGIYDALREGGELPPAWIADVRDAYEALLLHPAGTEPQAQEYLGLLEVLEARSEQGEAVMRALERFPSSSAAHAWLRAQVLRDHGAAALELAYAHLGRRLEDSASLRWFHGLALLTAAERHVGNRDPEAAHAAYARAVVLLRSSIEREPRFEDTAQHYVCLARAGEARLHAEAGSWDAAVAALREAVSARAASVTTPDGLGNTPAQTAQLVLRGLADAGRVEEAGSLRAQLSELGVELAGRRQGD